MRAILGRNNISSFSGALLVLLTSTVAFGSYAQSIVSFAPGSSHDVSAPITNILGAPDIGSYWQNVQGSIGNFGSVIVDMGAAGFANVPGPDILFWFGGSTDSGVVDGFMVWVSADVSTFHFVTSLPKEDTVPGPPGSLFSRSVDIASSGLTSARYIWITDMGTDQQGGGLKLNAIEVAPEVIPEPVTICLLGLGALGLLRRKRCVKFVPMN
ncbi:MAG: PEP-CTERM sorting domain-containing protein [Sedimentisphaerales bacterium]